MLTIQNVKVYDLEESVIACRNAMRLTPPVYTEEEFKQSLERAIQLARCGSGSGHRNFKKGIRVSFDIVYPNYISPELQRYSFIDIVSSSSKMHRLINMDLDACCNKYVPQVFIDEMNVLINRYNLIKNAPNYIVHEFTLRNGEKITAYKKDALYYAFMQVLSACPQGIELFMRCSTNYEQLTTIYRQRKGHKLREDWGAFLEMIENLPYSKELITCDLL